MEILMLAEASNVEDRRNGKMAGITCKMNCESRQEGRCVYEEIIVGRDGKCGSFREKKVPEYEPISVSDVVIYDDVGRPSVMVCFKRVTNHELFGGSHRPHPAFVIGDDVYDEIYISKYPNTIIDGKAYSIPFAKPTTNVTLTEAEDACFEKGEGWHLMTAQERGLVALVSLKNGTLPHGNTRSGEYHADSSEKGICYDEGSKTVIDKILKGRTQTSKTLTGSGPATWSHNHTPHGVYDLCGNVWEWIRGLRLMNGALQVCNNNDAAMPIDLSKNGNAWCPVEHKCEQAYLNVVDNGFKVATEPLLQFDVPEQLRELALFAGEPNAYIYISSRGELFPICGGDWYSGANAGVFTLNLTSPRSDAYSDLGFRSAYFKKN